MEAGIETQDKIRLLYKTALRKGGTGCMTQWAWPSELQRSRLKSWFSFTVRPEKVIPLLEASASSSVSENDNTALAELLCISHAFGRLLWRVHWVPGFVPRAGGSLVKKMFVFLPPGASTLDDCEKLSKKSCKHRAWGMKSTRSAH